jgi:hypothetical protein
LIKSDQVQSAASGGALFAQFYEDHDAPTHRTAWAPLNLARSLLEKKEALDPEWRTDSPTLIEFVRNNFTHHEFGVAVCHEQDQDKDAWDGVNSNYGAVLARYAKAAGSETLASEARPALNSTLYLVDDEGRPGELFNNPDLGGWQEDVHKDVVHHYADALRAVPEWGGAN